MNCSVTFGADKQLTFTSPPKLCSIFLTRSVNVEVLQAFQAAWALRMNEPCTQSEKIFERPFELSQRKNFLGSAKIFAVWIDQPRTGEEVIVRSFSPESGLQWGFAKARVGGLGASSLETIMSELIEELLDQMPYIGFIEGSHFFVWSKAPLFKARIVAKVPHEKHPYLPVQKDPVGPPLVDFDITMEKQEHSWTMIVPPGKKLPPTDSLQWLIVSR